VQAIEERLKALLLRGLGGDAPAYPEFLRELAVHLRAFLRKRLVGMPEDVVAQLRHAPFRPAVEAMAPTLVYEATIVGDGSLPADLAPSIPVPTLAMAGMAGAPFMRETAEALAAELPNGRALVLEGQTHGLDAQVLGPILEQFFGEPDASRD
jgi:pimeloyl-ACP methyl ester carboxylesterase